MNPLIEQFKKYGNLSLPCEEEINQRCKFFQRRKGEHFLKGGQYVSSYFVIHKGLIRAYFYRDEKQITAWFGEENQVFASIIPAYTGKPSFEYLELLEDAEIYALATNDLDELYLRYPELNLIGRKIAEGVCVLLEERIVSLHTESALQRYHSMLEKQPNLLARVNLGLIASYLGMSPETLSRIRRF